MVLKQKTEVNELTLEAQRALLHQFRNRLSVLKKTRPYQIFDNDSIENVLKAQPKTLGELGKVKGFPKEGKRIKGYGEAVISIIKNPTIINEVVLEESNGEIETKIILKKSNMF